MIVNLAQNHCTQFPTQICSSLRCQDESCVSTNVICDGKMDCFSGEDELNCGCDVTVLLSVDIHQQCLKLPPAAQRSCHPFEFVCPGESCIPYTFVCDGIAHCRNEADEFCQRNEPTTPDIIRVEEKIEFYLCSSGEKIPRKYVDDLIIDCDNDELHYEHAIQTQTLNEQKCDSADMLSCEWGTQICFYRHQLCAYDRDVMGILTICRNGAHLEHCKYFECSKRFKCPDSYCIPYRRLCDGQYDCIDGDDEKLCVNYTCPSMLHCSNHTFCVHQSDVCNGHPDCPLGDDEVGCGQLPCPTACVCHNNAVFCTNTTMLNILKRTVGAKYFKFIHCVKCNSSILSLIMDNLLQTILYLDLSLNDIKSICVNDLNSDYSTSKLTVFNGSHNNIRRIKSRCFNSMVHLKNIDLKFNSIVSVHNKPFVGLSELIWLDLSFNKLHSITGSVFSHAVSLKWLDIRHNPIQSAQKFFSNPELHELYTDQFYTCCYIYTELTYCSATPSYLSTCDDLLSSLPMKMCIAINGIVATIFVILNCCIRMCLSYEKRRIDNIIVFISIIDGFLGLYLILIGSADLYFHGTFAGSQWRWHTSFVCALATWIYTFFLISSTSSLVFLAVSRAISAMFPLFARIIFYPMILKVIGIQLFIYSFISICLTSIYYSLFEQSPNSLCILVAFGQNNPFLTVMTSLAVSCQLFACLSIILAYGLVVHIVNRQGSDIRQHSVRGRSEIKYTGSLTVNLATVSNLICWLPSSILFMMALSSIMVWNVVLIIPINPTLNGFLFSLGTKEFKQTVKRIFRGRKSLSKHFQLSQFHNTISNSHESIQLEILNCSSD